MPARILLQLDTDPQPSTFDAVVAVDAGADVLLRHGGVSVDSVVPLVHGAMFTRGGADLIGTVWGRGYVLREQNGRSEFWSDGAKPAIGTTGMQAA